MKNIKTISAEALNYIDPNHEIILDVRTPIEHAEKYIGLTHAHVPLDNLNPTNFIMRHGLDSDSTILILCRSGNRASQAAEKFITQGYQNVKVIEGGIIACENYGYDLKGNHVTLEGKVKGPLSLERQIRIVAGLFVAIGAILGLFLNSAFMFIPLFVGCGLIFAGVTDRCGMALILTKAPWNTIKTSTCRRNPVCTVSQNKAKSGQGCQ